MVLFLVLMSKRSCMCKLLPQLAAEQLNEMARAATVMQPLLVAMILLLPSTSACYLKGRRGYYLLVMVEVLRYIAYIGLYVG